MLVDEKKEFKAFLFSELKKVLFICVHNSGRSQMAEAFLNHLAEGQVIARSAGTKPATKINPTVVEVMLEIGIDIRNLKPKPLSLEMLENADRIITMGCGAEEVCPASFVPVEDWELFDPEGEPIERVRQVRDEIKGRINELIKRLL
jgi:protein-tyrosine-phosphatase